MWPELMALAISSVRAAMSSDEGLPEIIDEAGEGGDGGSDHAPSVGSDAVAVVNAVHVVPPGSIARCVHCRDPTC